MKTIVCISDLQVPYHDVEAVAAIVKFIKAYQPDEVVSVGDEMDMQTISKWAKGTPLEFERSIAHDRDLTRQVLYDLTIEHMIRSNHTDRLFNTVMMRAPGLMGLPELELENFIWLEELGIEYHKDPYELAPGWLLFHGDENSVQPTPGLTALNLAKRTGMSVVCGHTHRMGLTHHTQAYMGGKPKTVWGLEVGNLMNYKHAKYIKAGLFTWQQGFGILKVDGKTVIPQLVPIINRSFTVDGKTWRWQMAILEDSMEIATTVARKVHRRYHTYFDVSDVSQELMVWVLKRQDKIGEWLDHPLDSDEYKLGVKKLGKTLTRHADKYCRRLKAQKLGYELRDEQFYDSVTIEDLLPYALKDVVDTARPNFNGEKISNTGNPAEGGNYIIQLFDIRRCLVKLSKEDNDVIRERFVNQLSFKEIADLMEVSESTAHRKVDGAIKRLSSELGGPNPWQREEIEDAV